MAVVESLRPLCVVLLPYRLLCFVAPLPLKIVPKGANLPTLRITALDDLLTSALYTDPACGSTNLFVEVSAEHVLTSGWPRNYLSNISCEWMVRSPEDQVFNSRLIFFPQKHVATN